MILKVGSVCVKTRGRDAGSKCVIVSAPSKSDKGAVVEVQGLIRKNKRKINVEHLILTGEVVKASTYADVVKLFKK